MVQRRQMEQLKAKFYCPKFKENRSILRERLCHILNTNPEKKFTLISAPAGFGKTTQLSEWRHKSRLENQTRSIKWRNY